MAKSNTGSTKATDPAANPFDPFGFFSQWQDLLSKSVPGSGTNPFDPFGMLRAAPVDFSKAFDPFQVARTMSGFKTPGADIPAVLDAQQKNMEALQKAQQVAFASMVALLQRQADMLREVMEETTRSAQDVAKGGSPEEMTAKQTASLQAAVDRGFAILRELSELVAKANSETFEVINKRFTEGVAEIRSMAPTAR